MKHISFFLKDIDRQINNFVDYKKRRSAPIAESYREHLIGFRRFVKKSSVYEIDKQDLILYKQHLFAKYPTNFMVSCALKSVKGFLTFFRCEMDKRKILDLSR